MYTMICEVCICVPFALFVVTALITELYLLIVRNDCVALLGWIYFWNPRCSPLIHLSTDNVLSSLTS